MKAFELAKDIRMLRDQKIARSHLAGKSNAQARKDGQTYIDHLIARKNWADQVGIKLGVRWHKQDKFNVVLEHDKLTSAAQVKRLKVSYIVRVRNCYTGKVRSLLVQAVSEDGARQQAKRKLKTHYTIASVIERRFAG